MKLLQAIYQSLLLKKKIHTQLKKMSSNLNKITKHQIAIERRLGIIEEDICTLFKDSPEMKNYITLEERVAICEAFIDGLEKIEIYDKDVAN